MNRPELQQLLSRQPFVPFRIHLKNGKVFDVPFAEVAQALSHQVLILIGLKQGTRQAKSYESFPYDYIDRIEERPTRTGTKRRKAS